MNIAASGGNNRAEGRKCRNNKEEKDMKVTVEMASSINGLIAYENGSEDFLLERNY